MNTVTLIRGPKPTQTYEAPNATAALRRATSLARLHGAELEERAGDYRIDATPFYVRIAPCQSGREE